MVFNRKLKRQLIDAQYRIKELEERLCPCESHNWVKVGYRYVFGNCEADTVYRYKCKTCGKEKEELT